MGAATAATVERLEGYGGPAEAATRGVPVESSECAVTLRCHCGYGVMTCRNGQACGFAELRHLLQRDALRHSLEHLNT